MSWVILHEGFSTFSLTEKWQVWPDNQISPRDAAAEESFHDGIINLIKRLNLSNLMALLFILPKISYASFVKTRRKLFSPSPLLVSFSPNFFGRIIKNEKWKESKFKKIKKKLFCGIPSILWNNNEHTKY